MDPAFLDAIASGVATYVERQNLGRNHRKVRVRYRPGKLDLLAFVGREVELPFCDFVAELEGDGYVVIGQGCSEGTSHWGAVVEPRIDEDWADCVVFETASIN